MQPVSAMSVEDAVGRGEVKDSAEDTVGRVETREKHECGREGTAETSSVGVTRALEGLSNRRHNGTGEDGKDGAGIAGPGTHAVVPV